MAVTMMGFVIDDDNILLIAEFAANSPDHLIGGFEKDAIALVLFQDGFCQFADLDLFPLHKSVEVGDDDF